MIICPQSKNEIIFYIFLYILFLYHYESETLQKIVLISWKSGLFYLTVMNKSFRYIHSEQKNSPEDIQNHFSYQVQTVIHTVMAFCVPKQ